ncbi:MAG: hypothetical protein IBX55_18275 [Methyloprofundus sp.]|nr:hypothetical protein [Methyloprofundus sp.]
MPNLDNLKPIAIFADEYSQRLGVKPRSIRMMIDRNQNELIEAQAVFKTKGKSRLIDGDKFMQWYIQH